MVEIKGNIRLPNLIISSVMYYNTSIIIVIIHKLSFRAMCSYFNKYLLIQS